MSDSDWIDCKERLPETCEWVLVCKHYMDAEFDVENGGYRQDKQFATPSFIIVDKCFFKTWTGGGVVTHWMPLPKLPKMKDDNV